MGETKAAVERVPLTPQAAVSASDIEKAVSLGIISAEQRDRLLSMVTGTPGGQMDDAARTSVSLVSVGYWAGSIAVLFALAWFLVDRWKSLSPAGVLVVALLYAACFALSSMFVRRLGYRFAAALLAVLTVGMAPIVAWSLESLLGLWPTPPARRDLFVGDVIESIRWIPVQLSMALAGLVALRKVRFGLLALTVAIPMGLALVQLTPWLFDPELQFRLSAWMALFASTLMFLAAFVTDRRRDADGEDFTDWLYLAALGFMFVGSMGIMDQFRPVRHALPVVVAGLVALGFVLRRRLFLLPATIFFIIYLAFLASDVFPTAVGFMLVMLAVGALLILGTVLLQRRFPQVIERFKGDGAARRAPRWLGPVYGVLAVIAFVSVFAGIPAARRDLARLQERRNAAVRRAVELRRSQAQVRRAPSRPAETPRRPPP